MTIKDVINAYCGFWVGITVVGKSYFEKYKQNSIPEEVLDLEIQQFTITDNYYIKFYLLNTEE